MRLCSLTALRLTLGAAKARQWSDGRLCSWAVLCVLVLLITGAGCAAAQTPPALTVHQVQVVHRHGARSPTVDYNETAICGTRYACGFLNDAGQAMLVGLGRFLRQRYTTDAAVVDPSAPFLTSDSYNLTVAYSRSTDVLRTLQSADAMLRGLFPNMDAYYPAIHTVDETLDSLLNTEAKPAIYALKNYGGDEEAAVCNPVVDRYFPDYAALVAIAREVHSEEYCARKSKKRYKCAKTLCNIGRSYESTGALSQYPLLAASLEALCAVTLQRSRFRYSYSPWNPLHVRQGSVGQELAQELLANARRAVAALSSSSSSSAAKLPQPYKLYQYSVHDTTLVPLAATLRDESTTAMLPPYGTTYVLELLTNASEPLSARSSYYVRLLRGYPGTTPESDYAFAWHPLELRCMNARYEMYTAVDHTCALEDFARLVDSSRPTEEAGMCYIDPVLLKRMNCSKKDTDGGAAVSDDCILYHRRCPRYACAPKYEVDAVDYRCRRKDTGGDEGGSVSMSSASTRDSDADQTPADNRGTETAGAAQSSLLAVACCCSFLLGVLAFSVGLDYVVGPCGAEAVADNDEEGFEELTVRRHELPREEAPWRPWNEAAEPKTVAVVTEEST